ncbi:MAG: TatD family hydrolase [Phycisphaerales bacterium]|jgi:TatD DNase family protein|nr:TatD family hydrolase [Phycisphaerales bacterium]
MIDSHCHLTDPRLGEQLQGVLDRAAAAGVTRMITVGTSLEDDRRCVELCRRLPQVRCAIGIHPNYVAESNLEDVDEIASLQMDPSVVALGEMGLDYHYSQETKSRQRDFFIRQLELARKAGRPVVIHCREAVEDTLAILRDFTGVLALFHCFTGTLHEARQVVDAGYYLGFGGAVTFKKSEALRDVAREVPTDRFVMETDAPYLTPEPMRKIKINEPAMVMHTAAVVAAARGCDVDEVDRLSTASVRRFFGWDSQ